MDIEDAMEKGMEKYDKRIERLWTRMEDLEKHRGKSNVRLVTLK